MIAGDLAIFWALVLALHVIATMPRVKLGGQEESTKEREASHKYEESTLPMH